MENRKFPYISFIASILAILGLIALTIIVLAAYIEISTSDQRVSGDTLSLGFFIIFYPIIALYGIVSSWYCAANTAVSWAKRVSYIMLAIHLVVLFPFCAMLLGWNDVAWVVARIATWFVNLFI